MVSADTSIYLISRGSDRRCYCVFISMQIDLIRSSRNETKHHVLLNNSLPSSIEYVASYQGRGHTTSAA